VRFPDPSLTIVNNKHHALNNLNNLHRSAYFLIANGLYSLRVKTLKSTRDLQSSLMEQI